MCSHVFCLLCKSSDRFDENPSRIFIRNSRTKFPSELSHAKEYISTISAVMMNSVVLHCRLVLLCQKTICENMNRSRSTATLKRIILPDEPFTNAATFTRDKINAHIKIAVCCSPEKWRYYSLVGVMNEFLKLHPGKTAADQSSEAGYHKVGFTVADPLRGHYDLVISGMERSVY